MLSYLLMILGALVDVLAAFHLHGQKRDHILLSAFFSTFEAAIIYLGRMRLKGNVAKALHNTEK